MLAYIKGTLEYVDVNDIVVDNNGIGYKIMVPLSVTGELPHLGEEVKIYVYMNVREDAVSLFGFLHRDDLDMFKKLISVNGIGPKGALGILSVMTPDDLRFAILSDNVKAISSAPGIGAKTAGKLILELKDKVDLKEAFEVKTVNVKNDGIKSEAVQALVALGYSQADALRGINRIELTEDMTVEELLKLGLKNM